MLNLIVLIVLLLILDIIKKIDNKIKESTLKVRVNNKKFYVVYIKSNRLK